MWLLIIQCAIFHVTFLKNDLTNQRIRSIFKLTFSLFSISVFHFAPRVSVYIWISSSTFQSNPYLPSKASPVTETQSGQPRPSPVLTRVSRVPLCRLLRCQPVKTRKMKRVSREPRLKEDYRARVHDDRVFLHLPEDQRDRFCKLLSPCHRQTNRKTDSTYTSSTKKEYEKSRLISRYIPRDNRVAAFFCEGKKFSKYDSNEYAKIDIIWKRGERLGGEGEVNWLYYIDFWD